ncbi:hypothetical protein N656DRAFT_683661, partial [Canariomyces notabilis]
MLPFLEVRHLPSSSSFYSAVIQPLGLRYHSTEDGHFPAIIYGDSTRTKPVFQIRQVVASRDRRLRTSRIVFSVPSAVAAEDTYEFALRANPDLSDADPRHSGEAYTAASGVSAHRTGTSSGGIRVLITDFDGNIMEVVYRPPPEYPSNYSGPTVRRTRSTSEEAVRILDWNYDVAASSLPPSTSRRPYDPYPEDDEPPYPSIRRSVTVGPSTYDPAPSAKGNPNGLSTGAVVGTLLGVAAGAALTYSAVKGDRGRSPRQEYDMPSFVRRSTFPERYDSYSGRKSRYADMERGVEKVGYSDEYAPVSDYRRPPPEYIARYSQVSSPRSREVDDIYDDSRTRYTSSRPRTSARSRSEAASNRAPYPEDEPEYRSYTGSRSSRQPPVVQRSYTYDTPERDSYVSARSHRSNSTLRAAPSPRPDPLTSPSYASHHSRSGSRVVTTTTIRATGSPRAFSREGSYLSARNVPLPESRATTYISTYDIPIRDSRPGTYVSARHVPLPPSGVGSSHARWDVEEGIDDDDDSVAPSDSISNVGSRRSGRS